MEYWVLDPSLQYSITPVLRSFLRGRLLRELCRRGHRDSAVRIQRPELGLSSIRRWVSRDGKLPGVIDLARAFEIKGF